MSFFSCVSVIPEVIHINFLSTLRNIPLGHPSFLNVLSVYGVYLQIASEFKSSLTVIDLFAQSHWIFPEIFAYSILFIFLCRLFFIIIIIIKAICNAHDFPKRPQMRCPAVRKCSCLYTMYHIKNSVFSSVLTVVRLQSDIRSATAIPHRRSGYSKASISGACVCLWNSYLLSVGRTQTGTAVSDSRRLTVVRHLHSLLGWR